MMQHLIFSPIYIFLFVLKIYGSTKITNRKKEIIMNRKYSACYRGRNSSKLFFFYKIYFVNPTYKIKDKSSKSLKGLHEQKQDELVENGNANKGKILSNKRMCEQDLVNNNKKEKERNEKDAETKKNIKKRANKISSKRKSSQKKSLQKKSLQKKSSQKKGSLKTQLTQELLNKIVQKEETKKTDKENKENKENEIKECDILKYFKIQKDGSIIGGIDAEENKKIINSTYMKKLLKKYNLKEEDILNNIKKSEQNIDGVLNNFDDEKHLEEEAKENEVFFTSFMNDTNNNIYSEELFNFHTISKKLKNILKEVIQVFLLKAENQFRELMDTKSALENINNSEDILQSFVSLLKNEYLFADLSKDTLLEITKKAVLLSYINKTFSNDFENFEWHRTLENTIYMSIKNTNVKIKTIIYSLNSISVTLRNKKEYTPESTETDDEYESVEDVIKNSLYEYEQANNLNFVNTFNVYISLN